MLTFEIKNFDGSTPVYEVIDYDLALYSDKPGKLDLIISDRSSVSKDATVVVKFKESVVFRGYLVRPQVQKDNTIKLSFNDRIELLKERYSIELTYGAGATIDSILADSH